MRNEAQSTKPVRLIRLYTLQNCTASEQTRAALAKSGIAFTEQSAVDQSPLETPIAITIVDGHVVAWRGHHSDLIALLIDLVNYGPVSAQGLYDLGGAREAVITRPQAFVQADEHGLSSDEFLGECGDRALYRGSTVLDGLGY